MVSEKPKFSYGSSVTEKKFTPSYYEYEGLKDYIDTFVKYIRGEKKSKTVGKPPTPGKDIYSENIAKQMPVLKVGSKGGYVSYLQRVLNSLGYKIKVDGIFGKQTQKAVIDFQKRAGLIPDGIVGEKTWKALFKFMGGKFKLPPSKPSKPETVKTKKPRKPEPIVQIKRGGINQSIINFLINNALLLALSGSAILAIYLLVRRK